MIHIFLVGRTNGPDERDGRTGRTNEPTEGSTRGPRGPKKLNILIQYLDLYDWIVSFAIILCPCRPWCQRYNIYSSYQSKTWLFSEVDFFFAKISHRHKWRWQGDTYCSSGLRDKWNQSLAKIKFHRRICPNVCAIVVETLWQDNRNFIGRAKKRISFATFNF